MKELYTPWERRSTAPVRSPEYPRPQLVRDSYLCLNGLWDYTVQDGEEYTRRRTGKILVPFFAGEPALRVRFSAAERRDALVRADVYAAGGLPPRAGAAALRCGGPVQPRAGERPPRGHHEGGYLPFCLDITELLVPGENRLTVAVTDDAEGGVYAFGKQRYRRGGIWYTATSGIWQTVWLESVPENYIKISG